MKPIQFLERPTETARVMVLSDDEVLSVRRPVTSKSRPDELDIPGGQVDEGESPIQAACRELMEETGLAVAPNQIDFVSATSEKDGSRTFLRYYYMFAGTGIKQTVQLCLTEHTGSQWLPVHDAIASMPFVPHQVALGQLVRY